MPTSSRIVIACASMAIELRLGEEVERRREHAAERTASVGAARYRDAMPDSERVPFPPELHAELAAIVGAAGVTTSPAELERHGHDESDHRTSAPDIVCFPTSTAQVAAVVGACAAHRVPMVPFGAGSSLEGHVAALRGGVSIDMTRMARILRVSVEDLDVTVEAGVHAPQLKRRLREHGVFFPVDPGADATLGGMVSTGASRHQGRPLRDDARERARADRRDRRRRASCGPAPARASRPPATTSRTSSSAPRGRSASSPRSRCALQPLPEAVAAAVCLVPERATRRSSARSRRSRPGSRSRASSSSTSCRWTPCCRHALPYTVAPTLLLEFHGSPDGVAEQAGRAQASRGRARLPDFTWAAGRRTARQASGGRATTPTSRRSHSGPAAARLTTDVCVPISRLADCVVETQADIAASGLLAPIVGHVGDGNFHVCVVLRPDDPAELERAKALNARLVSRALGMDGTCTGEHGVGLGKCEFLAQEHGPAALALMRALKHALDPRDLMNPGKIATPLAVEPATAAAATA